MSTTPTQLPKDAAAAEGKVNVQITGIWHRVPQGARIIDGCDSVGATIPRFCYHPQLAIAGSCRMCLVEQGMPPRPAPGQAPQYNVDGYQDIQWMPRAVIACANTVAENMGIRTTSELTSEARRSVLEFLLSNHPLDCPICDQAGECKLQEYSDDYGSGMSRFLETKTKKGKNLPIGPRVNLDQERCVLCTRCVRFMRDVVGEEVLGVVGRGTHNAISCYPGLELTSNYSMNTVDLCPVGALTSVDFRFKMRVWFLKSTPTIDVNCGTGTNINIWTRDQQVYRITPRQNEAVNRSWMPDSHRLNYKYINSDERILTAMVRTDAKAELRSSVWDATLKFTAQQLRKCEPSKTAIIASARMTNEELYLVKRLAAQLGITEIATVARRGEDDGMLIIRAVLALGEDITQLAGVTPEEIKQLDYLLALSHSKNATTERADVVLAGVTPAEKYGTMINVTGRIQRLNRALEPMGQSRDDWSILRDLLLLLGCEDERIALLDSARKILPLLAEEFEPLADLTWARIGNEGKPVIETGVTIPLLTRNAN